MPFLGLKGLVIAGAAVDVGLGLLLLWRLTVAGQMRTGGTRSAVAEEKGYFRAEGLDYEFRDVFKTHAVPDKVGAHTSFEKGRDTNVSCACHWTVNVAASQGHGKLYADAYSVSPAAVFVPPESEIREPQQLASVPISVGHQSGSHYSTIQALEQYLKPEEIKLSFADGILFGRLEKLIDRQVPAAALFSGPYYFLEQLGFRKIIDTTFMMASMITGDPDQEDVKKYFRALRSAQRDIDLRPELYTHYYRKEFPAALPRAGRHAPLGAGRAHRVRALHARDLRGLVQMGGGAEDLRPGADGIGALSTRLSFPPLPGKSHYLCAFSEMRGRRFARATRHAPRGAAP